MTPVSIVPVKRNRTHVVDTGSNTEFIAQMPDAVAKTADALNDLAKGAQLISSLLYEEKYTGFIGNPTPEEQAIIFFDQKVLKSDYVDMLQKCDTNALKIIKESTKVLCDEADKVDQNSFIGRNW